MTQYLVFENQNTAGLGTQKELVVNWSNIKQLRPVTNSKFKIELNNGGNLEFTLSYSASSNSFSRKRRGRLPEPFLLDIKRISGLPEIETSSTSLN